MAFVQYRTPNRLLPYRAYVVPRTTCGGCCRAAQCELRLRTAYSCVSCTLCQGLRCAQTDTKPLTCYCSCGTVDESQVAARNRFTVPQVFNDNSGPQHTKPSRPLPICPHAAPVHGDKRALQSASKVPCKLLNRCCPHNKQCFLKTTVTHAPGRASSPFVGSGGTCPTMPPSACRTRRSCRTQLPQRRQLPTRPPLHHSTTTPPSLRPALPYEHHRACS